MFNDELDVLLPCRLKQGEVMDAIALWKRKGMCITLVYKPATLNKYGCDAMTVP